MVRKENKIRKQLKHSAERYADVFESAGFPLNFKTKEFQGLNFSRKLENTIPLPLEKVKIGFAPKTLTIHNNKTTSQVISNELKYFNQGAIFYRIFYKKYLFWVFLKLFFDVKQGNIAFSNIILNSN